ncbi:hypothetical protein CEXT_215101 [Caerostris extrusa]|uniref:Uncharacterized protein n=1 Tax=Caerostris extrusa TaxID=172846 RepID=A0AAV4W869_CAEEX|nr:hypothetical protein CEXT_215101 [Caerostris extrusa]
MFRAKNEALEIVHVRGEVIWMASSFPRQTRERNESRVELLFRRAPPALHAVSKFGPENVAVNDVVFRLDDISGYTTSVFIVNRSTTADLREIPSMEIILWEDIVEAIDNMTTEPFEDYPLSPLVAAYPPR